jgi:hypothetical protein
VKPTLSERVSRYITQVPPAVSGQAGHNATFYAACRLVHGFALSPEEAYPFIAAWNRSCVPPWSERDLKRKLNQALTHAAHKKPRGYLLADDADDYADQPVPASAPLQPPPPTWPSPNLPLIDEIVRKGPGLCDLWESSPIRFEDTEPHAEEITDALFPGDPLLCCGKTKSVFATRRKSVWRNRLASLPLVVPTPMLGVKGTTQDGKTSEHTKQMTARKVYQVIEFDFTEKAKDGQADTVFAPLVRAWRKSAIQIADACAALLASLARDLPTLCVACHSGGKSVHGWFRVFDLNPVEQRTFMTRAVELGADRTTWLKSQFVRIPDGLRDNGKRQTTYYFNPAEAVQP